MILLWFTCNCSFRGRYDELRKILVLVATSCMLMLSKSSMQILSVSPTKGKKILLIKNNARIRQVHASPGTLLAVVSCCCQPLSPPSGLWRLRKEFAESGSGRLGKRFERVDAPSECGTVRICQPTNTPESIEAKRIQKAS